MIRKLRIKFVIINMTIVTIMLGFIFSMLYFSTGRRLEQDSIQMMERIAMEPEYRTHPEPPENDVRLPFLSILVSPDGSVTETSGGYSDLTEELAEELLEEVSNLDSRRGVLREYDLRFTRFETPQGERIVFTDITIEQSTLKSLLKNFTLTGVAAYVVFLGISILLARWAVRPVDEAWKRQKQFVADASHELKTPLTVITTNAELLASPDCTEDGKRKYSANILTMAKQMRGLVESLLELARIDNGSVSETKEPVSFSEAVSSSAMTFEPVFFEADMPFSYEVEDGIIINGIASRLRQLPDILLDNAAKYASPGGVTILRLTRTSHKRCLLEVSNQGEAIAPEDMKNLFKRFYRADKARSMNRSYGLGLSIAQSICGQQRGKIWAESKGGLNSFYIELPTV